jgi:hypothetical protein
MGVVELPQTIRLTPGHWIRLPGTGIEVLLMGKYREEWSGEVVRWRHDPQTPQVGYWDLTGIYQRLYVRRVNPYGEPVSQEERVRPLIRRPLPRPERERRPPVTAAYTWRVGDAQAGRRQEPNGER